jgi:hypothetical protein
MSAEDHARPAWMDEYVDKAMLEGAKVREEYLIFELRASAEVLRCAADCAEKKTQNGAKACIELVQIVADRLKPYLPVPIVEQVLVACDCYEDGGD